MKSQQILLSDKDAERIKRARLVKDMRILMGLKAQDVAKELNVLQSNYSKMERGLEPLNDLRFEIIKAMYHIWRVQEVTRLIKHIDYLNDLIEYPKT